MNFDELDAKMRVYEASIDQIIPPGIYLVARIDGRSFTRLTKETCNFEAPFDLLFRDMMINTVKELMNCGFRVIFGFTESDEISLLFDPNEDTFGRKVRKYNSILAGTASAAFSLQLGMPGIFDCRIIPLPNIEKVKDYFLWRQEDACRNALNSHCYWGLRKKGLSVNEATKEVDGKSISYKNELLFQNGLNFNDLPNWQKRGVGIYWKDIEKQGFNPITKESVTTQRRELFVDPELPIREEYGKLIEGIIQKNT